MTAFHTLGFPRIGAQRELKWAQEAYWRGDIDQEALLTTAKRVRTENWQRQLSAGVDCLPVGEFALYDHVLNTSFLLGHLPERVKTTGNTLDRLFLAARGRAPSGIPTAACEMTKWFDTNYHYLVPECSESDSFSLNPGLLLEEIRAAKALSRSIKPVILGPISYLYLAKSTDGVDRLSLLPRILPIYSRLFQLLKDEGIEWIQLDEPILGLELPPVWRQAFEPAYHSLRFNQVNVLLATYFASLDQNLNLVFDLPVQGVHLDCVAGNDSLVQAVDKLGPYKVLSLGVIDGRNIWRSDLDALYEALSPIRDRLGGRLWVGTSCSLLHVPYDTTTEAASERLPSDVQNWLSFAQQKLEEGRLLCDALNSSDVLTSEPWLDQRNRIERRRQSTLVHKPVVRDRAARAAGTEWQRQSDYSERAAVQQARWRLPSLPTTTIGSFPQTPEVRQLRRAWKHNDINLTEYEEGLRQEITACIRQQETIGLDVLVHGEAERNDMVEYFGELLEGIAATGNGWVQSYGSRCVKPPIIFGDIERTESMTVRWSAFAQSQSDKPVKGMLTGPVTLLKWAFVRDDQAWAETGYQLAAALRDEVSDLVEAGIGIIQVDEPALREGLPLKPSQHAAYLQWAVNSFRYATTGVADNVQIHTHMCYADFDDILPAIEAMDADVITLETARSANKLLQCLSEHPYHNGIGPGVYDIHSPNVPEFSAMSDILLQSSAVVPLSNLWVNPDCGLKTRRPEEVVPALEAMVTVAKALRQQLTDGAEP